MALMVILDAPEAVPLRVPRSVLLVVQVVLTTLPKTVTGTVTEAPLERTVPFVVVPILSMLRLPLLLTTTFSCVQLLELRVLTLPLTVVPLQTAVVHAHVPLLHVFRKAPAVVSHSVEPERDQSKVTAPAFVTPFVSIVVAEAVLANAIRASAATAAAPRILLSFIFSPWYPSSRSALWVLGSITPPRQLLKEN
jgi:hypothetical protein